MAKKPSHGSGDPVRGVQAAARDLRAALDLLSQRGHPASFDRGITLLTEHLGIPRDALADEGKKAHEQARAMKDNLGRSLQQRAEDATCAFSFKPPLIRFGCVTFRQDDRDSDTWLVTVMGPSPVARIPGHDPDELARTALNVIESIESALAGVHAFLRDAAAAYDILFTSVGSIEGVSPNPLLLLASKGRDLKKYLVSADNTPSSPGLSRAQGGFLLRMASQLQDPSGIRMRLRPATQQVTADDWRFVPVPDEPTPRGLVGYTPVGRVSIDREEGST